MQHLYPNFYSLVSAPSQPLDPRMRRRSFVWNPTNEQTQTGYWLWNAVPEDSTVNPSKFSLPVRRRSVSQTPMRTHSGFSIPETNANPISSCVASSSSSESSATPPPPPAPFADEPRETTEIDTKKVISLIEERSVHTSTPIAVRRHMPCEEVKTINLVATHPTCNSGSLRKNFVITTTYLPTGGPNDYRPTERVRVVPNRYAAAVYPSSRSDFTVNHLPPFQPCFVHPTRMQSAVSLQGLDRACQLPPQHCMGSQQVIRPKLVMGLRDLSSVNRLAPWSNRGGIHVRHPSQTNSQTLTPNWNVCNTFPTNNHHSRIHSVPTELPQVYSIQSSSIPSVRRTDPGRRLRMTERRRTLWGTPGVTAGYIPVVQIGSTFRTLGSDPFDTAASTTTLLCDSSSADDQTTLNKTDPGGLQNVCSDSGVDLAEVDSVDSKQNNINSRTSEVTPSSRRRKSFSIRRAQVVSAFEQSLNSMSQRLQMLTHTTAKKVS
ncbi:hypothetical protein AHF37_08047 [Paragonimus kellicotti]|nr:hypothetical protein AHF37_08047 [Paragonimus kellicotti]